MVAVIEVLGMKKAGKTRVAEYLISKLTSEGFAVGSGKHVHHRNFTMDVEGKDS